MEKEVTIGDAARLAGCSVPTIRYYEEVGLLSEANRTAGGHRAYRRQEIERLILVRRCRAFGMSVKQVQALIEIRDRPASCKNALDIISRHRDRLRERIAELKALDRALTIISARCESDCLGGTSSCCTIYDDLEMASAA